MFRKQNLIRTLLLAALVGAVISVGMLTSAPDGARGLGLRTLNSAFRPGRRTHRSRQGDVER